AGIDALGDAGGVLGLAVGGPLHAVLASPGTQLLLSAVALVGLVVLTRTSIRSVAGSAAGAGGFVRELARSLFEGPGSAEDEGVDEPVDLRAPVLYDQEADAADGADGE